MDEVRLAARRLAHRKSGTIAGILTLACSIGAAAATWSLLSSVLLHPLPIQDADRIVVAGTVTTRGPMSGTVYEGVTYPFLQAFREGGVFEAVGAEWTSPLSLLTVTSDGSVPLRETIGFATHDLFDLLGVGVTIGRGFTPEDDRRGAPPVAVLTDDYWRRAFDRNPRALGGIITVAGKAVTIVGVAQRDFSGLDLSRSVAVFLPLHATGEVGGPFNNYFSDAGHPSSPSSTTRIIARLRDGQSPVEAAARLAPLQAGLVLTPINAAAIPPAARSGMRQFARLLGATVGLLLAIGIGTVGMLVLIRTEGRREELSTCVALGAPRRRLAFGILAEAAIVSLAGAGLAVPIAWWLFAAGAVFQLPGGVAIDRLDLGLSAQTLAAAASSAVAAAVLIAALGGFGLAANPADSFRSRTGVTPRVARRRTRGALVISQVAIALVLVAGAGLLARSLAAALALNAGLDMGRVITSSVNLAPYGYSAARATAFFDAVRDRLTANPSVAAVAFAVDQGAMSGRLTIDGAPRPFPTQIGFTLVDDVYFDALGIDVSNGRNFAKTDRKGSALVAIVSESFGRIIADGASPIGRRVTMPHRRVGQPPDVMEVVGVVDDVVTRVSTLQPLDIYFPLAQGDPATGRSLVVRASGDSDAARREILGAIKGVDAAVIPSPVLTLEERIGRQMSAQRFGATVLGALGGIALLLTIMGAYVVGESMAAIRMREMGIRAALGATRHQLGAIVLRDTARLVGLGLVAGFVLAALGRSLIGSLLFRVQAFDPATLVAAAGSILVLTLLVSLGPALRAARVDLANVLRDV